MVYHFTFYMYWYFCLGVICLYFSMNLSKGLKNKIQKQTALPYHCSYKIYFSIMIQKQFLINKRHHIFHMLFIIIFELITLIILFNYAIINSYLLK